MDHLSFKMAPRPTPKPPGPDLKWFYLILAALGFWAVIVLVVVLVLHP